MTAVFQEVDAKMSGAGLLDMHADLGLTSVGTPGVEEYRKLSSLVLVNGLAGQNESWFGNRPMWSQHFDVSAPAILVYDGAPVQRRMSQGLPVSVEFLTDLLDSYLENYVQNPPYHFVASSLGGQIAVEYAHRKPDYVGCMVLLCPSGLATDEKLPVSDGVRHRDFARLVGSVFHDRRFACPRLVEHYERQFAKRVWRKGVFRTIQDTRANSIRGKLCRLSCPTLVICGRQDQIVDPLEVAEVVRKQPNITFRSLPDCGHAPQIECAEEVNDMVLRFLSEGPDA